MRTNRTSRRRFLKAMGLAAACGPAALARAARGEAPGPLAGSKPNIIFIFSDDLSYRDLSSYGQKLYRTPNLDRLATGGVRFNQAYAGSPECAPSRASLMTGMHMGHCRIRKNSSVRGQDHLLAEDITVAEVLTRAGYATGFVGKWGIGLPGTEGVPYKQGFDYAYGFYDQGRAHGYYPDFLMANDKRVVLTGNHGFDMERLYDYNRRPVGRLGGVANEYDKDGRLVAAGVAETARVSNSEDLVQEAALKFIRNNGDGRFFLYYATQIPHGPVITPSLGEFKDKDWSLKNKEWASMILHLDRGVGRITALLKELGIERNTLIFFAGDNGYSQWGYFARKRWLDDPLFRNRGPWRGGKFTCMEGGLRVPFFACWPGRIPARQSEHVCALYDFLATAADLAGVKLEHETDGISLVPELENRPDAQKEHEYLYWESCKGKLHEQAVRMGPWKAYRPGPDKPTQLYRIDRDVACRRDLAKDNREIVGKIERIFREARTDSEWYINPGESAAAIKAKTEKARRTKSMQTSTRANTTYTRKSGGKAAKSKQR